MIPIGQNATPDRTQQRAALAPAAALATLAGALATLATMGPAASVLDSRPDLAGWARLWIQQLPVGIAGAGAAVLVFWLGCGRPTIRAFLRMCEMKRRNDPSVNGLGWAVGQGVLTYALCTVVTVATVLLFKQMDQPVGNHPVVVLVMDEASWPLILAATPSVVLIAPLAEEFLFRFLFFESVAWWERELAPPLTAMAFAATHMLPEALPALFLLGLRLQAARKRTGTLVAPIVIHAVFNAIGLMLAVLAHAVGGGQ